ncbi:MAG: nucleotidyltransferase family protein [Gaiellaceae bacterium]
MTEHSRDADPVAAVVLAAGAASRFGAPKQNLLLPGVVARLEQVALDEIVVVEGAHPIDVPLPASARRVECPSWDLGPGASLKCGLATLADAIAAAIVVLADGPLLEPRAVDRVVRAWECGAGPVLAAAYDGTRSHPVLLARSTWAAIPAAGGRDVDAELVDCSDLTHPGDVDTAEDLARLEEDLEL